LQIPFTSTPRQRSTFSAFFRAVNNDIMRLSGAGHDGPRQILCECSKRNCAKTIAITAADYRAIRSKPARFIVAPGHELGRLQRVVTRTRDAFVVEENEACQEGQPLQRITPIVLVVDDVPMIRELCARHLRESGVVVFEAPDGQIALEQARTLLPDLVVSDVSMPVLDGFRFAEAMRRDDRTQAIPLIFISGETDRASESQALEIGALAILQKPFDPPALTAIATGVLARFAGANAGKPAATPIRRRRLQRAGEPSPSVPAA
jgi:CheY-like chemotaxis protein